MYDVVIIGCGPGGYAAAIRAAQLRGKVAIVEGNELGGTCVNLGCIPSKILLRASNLIRAIKNGNEIGIDTYVNKINLHTLVKRKDDVIKEIKMGMESLLAANGVKVIKGHGFINDENSVRVDDKNIECKNIILATGSSIQIPTLEGLNNALITTSDVLDMTKFPNTVMIWGDAGPIDVEMANILNDIGSEVYLVTSKPRILYKEDHETSQRLTQALRARGINIMTKMSLVKVKDCGGMHEIELFSHESHNLKVSKVLVCNRRPRTDKLNLNKIGVYFGENGSVEVDERLQTSVEGIYAIGDITGGWMNSQCASAMGITAAENTMGMKKEFSNLLVPRGIWSSPQVGSVGMSEEDAEKRGIDIETGTFPYAYNGLAMCNGEIDGAVKIVLEEGTQEILGIHIVGTNATELIGEAVMALKLECTAAELAETIRVHPTFSEGIVEAGRDAAGWAIYLHPNT